MTLPTTINDIADLYHILEVNPSWREALRHQLLSAELLAMPEQLTQLAGKIDQLTDQVAENSRQIADNARQIAENSRLIADNSRQINQLSEKVDRLTETVADNSRQIAENSRLIADNSLQIAENSRQIAELTRTSGNHTSRMTRIESDTATLKSRNLEREAESIAWAAAIALDWTQPVALSKAALAQLVHNRELTKGVRTSFVNADLIFQASDAAGNPAYCAVEISWTINQYDLDRARRNAELLQETTGGPAQAAVYGERYEWDLDWGQVLWLPLEQ